MRMHSHRLSSIKTYDCKAALHLPVMLQVVRTGTDAQISGGTPTPSYSSSLFPWKYLDDELVQQEQGWKLNFLVWQGKPCVQSSLGKTV